MEDKESFDKSDFQKIFQALPGNYLILAPDPQFTILATSDAWDQITMRRRDEIIGKPLLEVFSENSKDLKAKGISNLKTSLQKVLKNHRPDKMPVQKYDIKGLNKDFEERFWSPENVPVLGKDGEVIYIIHQVEDVTSLVSLQNDEHHSKKLVEKISDLDFKDDEEHEWVKMFINDIRARKNSEEILQQLTSILEATPDLIATADELGRLIYLNHAGRELTGIRSEEVTLKTIADIHTKSCTGKVLREAIPLAIEKGMWIGECTLKSAKNAEILVSEVFISHKDEKKGLKYLSIVAHDIVERKHSEEIQNFLSETSKVLVTYLEYERSLEELASIVVPKFADICLIDILNDDGEVNRLVACHRENEKSKKLKNRKFILGTKNSPVGMWEVLKTGKAELVPYVTDAWILAATADIDKVSAFKDWKPESLIIAPLKARGRILGVIKFVSIDPSHRYGFKDLALAEELASRAALATDNARLYKESKAATKIRDEVLRIVAHDLRNPINVILLGAEGILKNLPVEKEKERRQCELIKKSAQTENHLIQDLLDVARMQARKVSMTKTVLEAEAIINEAIELHRSLAESRSLILTSAIHRLPYIFADKGRLAQVFSNLIGNALKFSSSGGRILVGAEVVGEEVKFWVSDSGSGIPAEHIPYLFDPFWQAQQDNREGAGLGLAITKGIVEAHDGRIWVESEVGKGTTFFFTIPVHSLKENLQEHLH